MKDKHRNLRKAAVLVASLDAERAEDVLAQMTPSQAQMVRNAVEQLGPLDPAEQQEVIEEFFRIGPLLPDREASGIELSDPRCASFSIPKSKQVVGPCGAEPDAAEFGATSSPGDGLHSSRNVSAASPAAIALFLAREQPQTIAVFVSRLSGPRAAEVLAALPAETQIEVARRVVDLDETDPDILREIERGLEAWLDEQARAERRRAAGMTTLKTILQASSPQTRKHILAHLAPHESAPAAREKCEAPKPLSFAELEQFDAQSLSAVFKHAQSELLVLALAGARPEFAARALDLFTPAKAHVLRRALVSLGPTRLSDIEEAQAALARLAAELDQRGEIRPRTPRHLSVAV